MNQCQVDPVATATHLPPNLESTLFKLTRNSDLKWRIGLA
jgi:hypothetical protein